MKKFMVQILDRRDKMSDSKDTLPDIDIVRCPTVISSLTDLFFYCLENQRW